MCYINYGVTFPMFAKSAVKGKDANAFFKTLAEESGVPPKWNFYKYIVGANGKVLGSFSPTTGPDSKDLEVKIESALAEAAQQKK
jgi:glutathione peroxidase